MKSDDAQAVLSVFSMKTWWRTGGKLVGIQYQRLQVALSNNREGLYFAMALLHHWAKRGKEVDDGMMIYLFMQLSRRNGGNVRGFISLSPNKIGRNYVNEKERNSLTSSRVICLHRKWQGDDCLKLDLHQGIPLFCSLPSSQSPLWGFCLQVFHKRERDCVTILLTTVLKYCLRVKESYCCGHLCHPTPCVPHSHTLSTIYQVDLQTFPRHLSYYLTRAPLLVRSDNIIYIQTVGCESNF